MTLNICRTLCRHSLVFEIQLEKDRQTVHPWLEKKVRQGFELHNDEPVGSSSNPSNQILTVANAITLTRLILTLVFLILFVTHANRLLAIIIYAVAASTDWLDGQIARRTQTVSWFGKLLDPICDRFLLFTGVLGLVVTSEIPVWVAILIIGRDIYLAFGAAIVRRFRERPIDVVYIGKVATALLMIGFCGMLLGVPTIKGLNITTLSWLPGLNMQSGPVGLLFVYAGCICSLITACVYTVEGVSIGRAALERKEHDA